jgi:phage terminase large subunit-like protein
MPLILNKPDLKSGANWIACAPPDVQAQFLNEMEEGELLALPFLFEFWAFEHQLPPEGAIDWRTWIIMGGRGAGKTRAGVEWVRSRVEGPRPLDDGACSRVALVGETIDEVREVMIFGDSGIMACSPPYRRPTWQATRKRLVWPNGAIASVHTAHDPEGLRGPQFDAARVDELAKWKRGKEAWDQLQFALLLGDQPQVCVTTTPRNVGVLKSLLQAPSTVVTHAKTEANKAYLAGSFLEEVRRRYAGTRLGRQELDGVLLSDAEGAL